MPVDREANEPVAQACRDFAQRHFGQLAGYLRAAGIGRSTWDDWLNERTTVPAWAPVRIYGVSGDLQFFAEATGAQEVGVILSLVQRGSTIGDLQIATLELMREHGRLAGEVATVTADGRVDPGEARSLEERLSEVERACERARQTARELSRRPVHVRSPGASEEDAT